MQRPFFTVAIPAKNRPDRLANAIRSVLFQSFGDFEVIVCDNSDPQDVSPTRELIRSFSDSRLRYIRTNGRLSMPDNWERACADAHGEFVTILTDRSVFRRDALQIIHDDIQNTGAQVVTWHNDMYGRDATGKEFRPRQRSLARRKLASQDVLNFFLHGPPKSANKSLPKLLTSCCHRSILDTIRRSKIGRCFVPVSPDYTSSFLVLGHSDWMLLIDDSLYVSCGLGNGWSFRRRGELAARFLQDLGMTLADLVDRMPSPACFSHATSLNDFMRIKDALPERFAPFELDHVQYYVGCLIDYVWAARKGVDQIEELDILLSALATEPDNVQRAVRAERRFISAVVARPNLRRNVVSQEAEQDSEAVIGSTDVMRFETVFDALKWSEEHPREPGGLSPTDGMLLNEPNQPERPWWEKWNRILALDKAAGDAPVHSHTSPPGGGLPTRASTPRKVLAVVSDPKQFRDLRVTLAVLVNRGFQVHVASEHGEVPVRLQMERLSKGVTFGRAPDAKVRTWEPLASHFRQLIDYVRFLQPQYAGSLVARAAAQAPRLAARLTRWVIAHSQARRRVIERILAHLERAIPADSGVMAFLKQQQPDAIILTGLADFGSSQVDYVRAARASGIPTLYSVGAWDDLTAKGHIHEVPDCVAIWNPAQRRDGWEFQDIPADTMAVTGSPVCDALAGFRPSVTREDLLGRVGLDPADAFILYAGSLHDEAPDEPAVFEQWLRGLRAHGDPHVRSAGVVLHLPHGERRHWRNVSLSELDNVAVFSGSGKEPTDDSEHVEFLNAIHHSAAVVSLSARTLMEAAILGRPACCITSDEYDATRAGRFSVHHFNTLYPGTLYFARSLDEQIEQLQTLIHRSSLEPDPNSRAFVRACLRPHGDEILPGIIFGLVTDEVQEHQRLPVDVLSPLSVRAARWALYPAAVALHVFSRLIMGRSSPASQGLRVLVAMPSPGQLPFYDSVIDLLVARGHQVRMAYSGNVSAKALRFKRSEHVTVQFLPQAGHVWRRTISGIRDLSDFVRALDSKAPGAATLRAELTANLSPAFGMLDRFFASEERRRRAFLRALSMCERAAASQKLMRRFLKAQKPDVVLITSPPDDGQLDLAGNAKAMGIRTGLCLTSWTDLDTPTALGGNPDIVFTWNEGQKEQAVELLGVPAENVVVAGAPPFDRWYHGEPARKVRALRELVGLPEGTRYVLCPLSSVVKLSVSSQLLLLRQWLETIRASEDSRLASLGLLIRPDPGSADALQKPEAAEFLAQPGVAVWPRGRYDPDEQAEQATEFDCVYYSSAVIGLQVSDLIAATLVRRPAFLIPKMEGQEGAGAVDIPEAFRGAIQSASTLAEHAEQLKHAIRTRATISNENRESVCRALHLGGTVGTCTRELVDGIEALGQMPRVQPLDAPIAPLLRPAVLGMAIVMKALPRHARAAPRRLRRGMAAVSRSLGHRILVKRLRKQIRWFLMKDLPRRVGSATHSARGMTIPVFHRTLKRARGARRDLRWFVLKTVPRKTNHVLKRASRGPVYVRRTARRATKTARIQVVLVKGALRRSPTVLPSPPRTATPNPASPSKSAETNVAVDHAAQPGLPLVEQAQYPAEYERGERTH